MAYNDLENKDCFCSWLDALGDYKTSLVAFIESAITLLQSVQALYAATNIDLSDEYDKLTLQLELEYLEAKYAALVTPIATVAAYMKQWGDCKPVAKLAKDVKEVRDDLISDIEDRRFEIEQRIDALGRRDRRSERVDRWIDTLETTRDAIEYCGEDT
jgi:hypothetical protein